jgi:hypothetical protein
MILKALLNQFLSGGIMVGFLACGFFFYRFWKKTRDTLFAVFAVSFWILAVERIFLLATVNLGDLTGQHELREHVYWFRFIAFMLIIIAFVLKNREQAR